MSKRIVKIISWLIGAILLFIIMQVAVTQSILYVFNKDHRKISKQIDTALNNVFHDNIKISGSAAGASLTSNEWIKHIIFNDDSSRIDMVLFKYYFEKQVDVWNTPQSLAMLSHACQSSDNLSKGSVLCNDMPMKGSKTLVLARKNYWVRIYWKDTTQLSLERVIGVAQAVEKTIMEN